MKGATLLESLVAMVILAFCFSLSAIIFASVLDSDSNKKNLLAVSQMNEISQRTRLSKAYFDEEIKTEGFTFIKKINVRDNAKGLIEMKIKAYDSKGHLIAERKELVLATTGNEN